VRYDQKCTLVFTQSTRYSRQILIKLELSHRFSGKIFKYKISRKSVQWEPSIMLTDTNRHDEPNSRFS